MTRTNFDSFSIISFFIYLLISSTSNLVMAESPKWICEEKEVNLAGLKSKKVINWNDGFLIINDAKQDGMVEDDKRVEISIKTNSGIMTKPISYSEGMIVYSFDGSSFTTHYVTENRTYIVDYSCLEL